MLAGERARDLYAFAEAQQHFERAAELRGQVSDAVAAGAPPTWELLRNAAHCARYSGDIRAGAVPHLRRAIAVLGEDGDRVALGGLWAELSESLWMAGLGDEASAASDRSVEVLGNSTSRERAEALGWRSRLSMLLGRYRDAIPPGTEAVGLARTINASRELSRALNALGTSLAMVGNQEGMSMLREAFAMIDDPIAYYVVPLIARVEATGALLAHDPGAPGRISRLVDLLRTVHDSVVPGGYLAGNVGAWLCLTEAELSRAKDDAAPGLWREALLRIREVTYAEHELYAALRLAEALAATRDTANAEAELAPAYERARSIGAVPLVAEMEAIARRARLKLSAMPQVGADSERGLTGREREVLVLVSQGRTNREIGQSLFISEKTASVHVSNILAKLGAANRAEAGAKARALGLDRI